MVFGHKIHKESFGAAATLMGFTIGAGILGVPYVMMKGGFLTGLVVLFFVAGLTLYLNLAAGEVSLRTNGFHQYPALVRKYLGKRWERLMLADIMLLSYGALSAYIIGGGKILTDLLGGDLFYNSLVFGLVLGLCLLLGINFFEGFELFFMGFMVLILFGIGFFAKDLFSWANLFGGSGVGAILSSFSWEKLYLPLPTLLFAFMGVSAVPELKEELRALKNMKFSIIFGVLFILAVYLFFSMVVVGVSGSGTSQVATVGAGEKMGFYGRLLFSLFGFVALITSFIGIGFVLKDTFHLDLGLSLKKSWLLTIIPPLLVGVSGFFSFITILNVIGLVHGFIISYITFNLLRASKVRGERRPEYSILVHPLLELLIYVALIIAAVMTF